MHILVTGASGFIGSALVPSLQARGHRVSKLTRSESANATQFTWNPDAGTIHLASAQPLDAVVHLAGENVGQRWTEAAKRRIRESRANATRLLSHALARLSPPPRTFVSASAIGIYGDRGDEWLDESSPAGTGFLADICREWEAATGEAAGCGIRVVSLRFGIVLAAHGGALAKMLPAFRLGLGGRLGDGTGYWSWIALDDAVNAIHHALEVASLSGPVNAVSPNPVTNGEFTRTLGRVLKRPTPFPVPRCVVELLFGEMGREALLGSVRVQPKKLLASEFQYRFPTLEAALREALGRPMVT